MESSSSSFKVFWRKRLPRRYRFIYYSLTLIAVILILIIPAYTSWSYLNNLNKESELAEILEADNQNSNTLMLARKGLKECSQLEARLESIDPNSSEYETVSASYDSIRQEIAELMPSLVKSYDENGLPVLMPYREYLKKTVE